MSNHAANIKKSQRLRDLYFYLCQRGKEGATTMQIVKALNTMNPGRDASEVNLELRKARDKRRIVCTYEGMTAKRKKVYRYRLVRTS